MPGNGTGLRKSVSTNRVGTLATNLQINVPYHRVIVIGNLSEVLSLLCHLTPQEMVEQFAGKFLDRKASGC